MKLQHITTAAGVAIGLTILVTIGCGGSSLPPVSPQSIAANSPQKAMEMYDANKDGFLDDKELEKVPGLAAAKQQLDTDHDGKISADEIAARIDSWRQSKLGRTVLTCVITRNGKPLNGATVVLAPEPFLGDQLTSGSGTTDASGRAFVAAAGDPPGLSPGFYRVQVTKDGDNIPAKFNTETILGQEIAADAAGIGTEKTFDLQY
jgi:hypothetical protein